MPGRPTIWIIDGKGLLRLQSVWVFFCFFLDRFMALAKVVLKKRPNGENSTKFAMSANRKKVNQDSMWMVD